MRIGAALALALAACAAPALAQSDASSISARASTQQVARGDAIVPEHALGDWGGRRTRWKAAGVDLQFGYLSETAGIASGGLRKGVSYAHQVKFQADLDGDALAGVDGLGLHAVLVNRAGRSASADYLGDDLFQVQEIYGGTGHALLHLSFLYAEYATRGGLDLKVGRLAVGQDFAASPLYCQYLALGLCPQPRALSLANGFSIVPSATWGGRVRLQPGDAYVQAGIYQVRPRYGGPSGFDWGFSHSSGVILPVEAGWEPRFGPRGLQGHYKAGLALDTSNIGRLAPGRAGQGHSLSWYVLADQMVVRTGDGGTSGLVLQAGWSHADADVAALTDFLFAGLAARGLIRARPGDVFNLLFGHGDVSAKLTAAQRATLAADGPPPSGFAPAPGSFGPARMAPGVQTSHHFVEGNYGFKLREGITLTPDIQYLWRPGAARDVPDALVLAGRIELNL